MRMESQITFYLFLLYLFTSLFLVYYLILYVDTPGKHLDLWWTSISPRWINTAELIMTKISCKC